MFSDHWLFALLSNGAVSAVPLMLAACGGYLSERGGVINIGLEGKMLMSAALVAIAGVATGSAWIGLAAGIGAAIALAIVHWVLTQKYRMDHIISGMAINVFALGASGFLMRKIGDQTEPVPTLTTGAFLVTAFAVPAVLALFSAQTRDGLRLKAVGSDPDKSRQMGLFPETIRLKALIVTGALCGIAGAAIISTAGYYTDNVTAGRGYIALAALIIGGWRPVQAALACFLFGIFDGIQLQLQGQTVFGVKIPVEFWHSLPYIVTIIAIAGFLGRSRAPAGLGKH